MTCKNVIGEDFFVRTMNYSSTTKNRVLALSSALTGLYKSVDRKALAFYTLLTASSLWEALNFQPHRPVDFIIYRVTHNPSRKDTLPARFQ